MVFLILGVLRVNPTSIRRRRKDSLVEDSSISNDTLSTATNNTVNSLSHRAGHKLSRTGNNSTDTDIGEGNFEEEEERGEDEEAIGETATPPSDEYDSLLRDLNAREKVRITVQSDWLPSYDGQFEIVCHSLCPFSLFTFLSIYTYIPVI